MDKQSLEQMWKEAQDRFLELTEQNLKLTPPRTLDDVRKQIESDSGSPKEKESKRQAKDMSLNALSCIKLLGGVAAQAGAMAFGPSELCFNAVSLLLDIPSKIHEFHAAVDGLLEEVSVMLGQFKIYQRIEQFSNIDPELYDTIQKLMISFVQICALAINLRNSSRWKRFRSATKKILCDDDSGVKQELDAFKLLIQKQSVIRETVTLENVLRSRKELAQLLNAASESGKKIADIATGIDVLTTAESNRKLENITKEQQKKIQKKLFITNDTAQASKTICNDLWTESVQRTGAWLRDMPEYISWADVKSDANPLLFLTGDTNSGKSFLVSAIIHGLQSMYGHGTHIAERTPLLAYHYIPKHTEKTSHLQRPAETALKCLALQIAEQDTAYAKATAAYCDLHEDSHFKDSSCKELWSALKFISPKRDITYFLILDGLDQLSDDDKVQLHEILSKLQNSLSDSDGSQIRILASAKSGTFDLNLFRSVPNIDIEQHNEAEIRYYIDNELLKRDLLLGKDAETVKLRGLINNKLPGIAQGNFFKVQTALEKIENVVAADGSSTELEKILSEAGQDRESIARTVVNDLSENLNAKEIEELNELLIWVVFGTDYFLVEELRAALYLCFRTTSLQPLEKKIRGKYGKLFEINGDGRVAIVDDVEEIVKTPESTRRSDEDTPKITATITITKADIKTVQNFLWNLTEKAMIDQFRFDDSAAGIKTKGSIRVNEFDAHLTIVKQAFKLLLSEPDEKTQALGFYALGSLPFHLHFLRDNPGMHDMAAADKREVGKGVFSLLVDGEFLEKFWEKCGYDDTIWFYEEYGWFFDDDDGLNPFWKWLEDADAIRYLGKKDKEWLSQLKLQPSPNRSLLEPVTLMVAKRWLQDREWNARGAFAWIDQFLSIKPATADDETEEVAPEPEDQEEAEKAKSEATEDGEDGEDSEDGDDEEDGENEEEDEDGDGESAKEDAEDSSERADTATEDNDGLSCGSSGSSSSGSSDSSDSSVTPESVAAAVTWVQNALKVQEPNSLWFERLGETYSQIIEYESAIEAYTKAIALSDPSWQCFEGLAMAHSNNNERALAASAMETALQILRKIEAPSEDDHNSILTNLIRLADWEAELQQSDVAINHYEEALLMDPNNSEAQAKMLKIMLTIGHDDRARELLAKMSQAKAKDADLSQLAAIFPPLLLDVNDDVTFSMIFLATHKTPFFTNLLEDIDHAIDFARNEERNYDLASLLLHKGVAIYHYDQREERSPESALGLWEEAGSLSSKEEQWRLVRVSIRAFRMLSSHHFHQARASSNPAIHIEKMEQISTRRFGSGYMDSYARSYLGCYYALAGDQVMAKKVFLGDIKSALALLSDDDEENDYQGYYHLADILMHSGDYLNALSAWSLLGPTDGFLEAPVKDEDTQISAETPAVNGEEHADIEGDKEAEEPNVPLTHNDRSGDLLNQCDGRCGRSWHYSDDFYCCKMCPDVQFCDGCLDKLKAGTLRRYICNPKHDWLHIPKWEDEAFKEIREGKVKIGGELKEGVRVGWETVGKEEWLNVLRDAWGIPRVEGKVGGSGEVVEVDEHVTES